MTTPAAARDRRTRNRRRHADREALDPVFVDIVDRSIERLGQKLQAIIEKHRAEIAAARPPRG